eukprot:3329447-Rhodomonas_salina.1
MHTGTHLQLKNTDFTIAASRLPSGRNSYLFNSFHRTFKLRNHGKDNFWYPVALPGYYSYYYTCTGITAICTCLPLLFSTR